MKFHWKPVLGLQSVLWNEAVKINGADPDFHRRDLWDAINTGGFPEWELGLQVFDDEFADRFAFDILDPTKIIPEEEVPVRRVGRLVLDRVVDNFFAETEQVAFCTQNIVPGIDFTNDPLLQGRNFSYLDTQLKRLGSPNFTHLPVNAPKCPFATFQQDGHMATVNPTSRANYEPNSWEASWAAHASTRPGLSASRTPTPAPSAGCGRTASPITTARPGSSLSARPPIERAHIVDAFVFELSKCVRPAIRQRMVAGLRNVDEDLARDVADGLGLTELPDKLEPARAARTDLQPSPALSILSHGLHDFGGRKIAVLITDGFEPDVLASLRSAAEAESVTVEVVAAKIGGATGSDGSLVSADQKLDGAPSVLYDAVVILASEPGAANLAGIPAARDFVTDAYAHRKFFGYTTPTAALFSACGLRERLDDGFIEFGTNRAATKDFLTRCRQVRFWARQP